MWKMSNKQQDPQKGGQQKEELEENRQSLLKGSIRVGAHLA